MRFTATVVGTIIAADDETDDDIERWLDATMDELLALDALDPSIDAGIEDRSVRFSLAVDAANPVEAVNMASTTLRTAIHAAGGGTPDWPTLERELWGLVLLTVNAEPEVTQATDHETVLADA